MLAQLVWPATHCYASMYLLERDQNTNQTPFSFIEKTLLSVVCLLSFSVLYLLYDTYESPFDYFSNEI